MRQYFTGFFTASFLATSLCFFIISNTNSSEKLNLPIIIEDDKGKIVISSESIRLYNKKREEVLSRISISKNWVNKTDLSFNKKPSKSKWFFRFCR